MVGVGTFSATEFCSSQVRDRKFSQEIPKNRRCNRSSCSLTITCTKNIQYYSVKLVLHKIAREFLHLKISIFFTRKTRFTLNNQSFSRKLALPRISSPLHLSYDYPQYQVLSTRIIVTRSESSCMVRWSDSFTTT
jgi:hypothetical protein